MNNTSNHTSQDAGKLAGLLEQITPGPWRYHLGRGSEPRFHIGTHGGYQIASSTRIVHHPAAKEENDMREANAQFIALAPQLAASLIETVAALEQLLIAANEYSDEMRLHGRGHAGLGATASSDSPAGKARAALANARKVMEGGQG